VINAEECIDNLPVVLQVHQHQARASVAGAVKVQHLVTFVVEPLDYAPAELSASACNGNLHQLLSRYRYFMLECYLGPRPQSPRTARRGRLHDPAGGGRPDVLAFGPAEQD